MPLLLIALGLNHMAAGVAAPAGTEEAKAPVTHKRGDRPGARR